MSAGRASRARAIDPARRAGPGLALAYAIAAPLLTAGWPLRRVVLVAMTVSGSAACSRDRPDHAAGSGQPDRRPRRPALYAVERHGDHRVACARGPPRPRRRDRRTIVVLGTPLGTALGAALDWRATRGIPRVGESQGGQRVEARAGRGRRSPRRRGDRTPRCWPSAASRSAPTHSSSPGCCPRSPGRCTSASARRAGSSPLPARRRTRRAPRPRRRRSRARRAGAGPSPS